MWSWTKLLILFLGLVAWPAGATDWWWVGTSDGSPARFNAYVEAESATIQGKRSVRVWVYTHTEAPLENGEMSARALNDFDCLGRTWTLRMRASYDVEGRLISSHEYRDEPPGPIAPGTMADRILQVVCGNQEPSQRGIEDPLAHSLGILPRRTAGAAGGSAAGDESGLSVGTGFFVGPNGLLLTSYHVIAQARRISCRTTNGEIWPASLVRGSPSTDLAVLQVTAPPTQYLGLAAPNSLRHGDRVFTMGFPAVDILGLEPRFTEGTVSALSVAGEDVFIQISVPIQPGNSGGPLVTESGQVVGIVAATAAVEAFYRTTGAFPQNVNWAVKADYARPLLGSVPSSTPRSRQAAIDLARQSICLIVAER